MRKTTQLKNLIHSRDLEFLCEAHNGLSAKIVENSGFKGIWGSGLALSAQLGVRDSNEASWTQILEVMEFMSDATSIPILLDGDTGYGNFNNMQRLVKKLEQRNIAGVCIEDKLFPKTNSFINGDRQVLEDIDTFCGKIRAGKDAQTDDDFCIVARVEAFIVGYGLQEALKRAEAYRLAGADAILIHSKKNTPEDIEEFMKEWGNRHPVVIVPTKYFSTPTDRFRELGISLVIWANHIIRASTNIMQKIARKIHDDQTVAGIVDSITPVSEIFKLQGVQELLDAESRYLPTYGKKVTAIILAASQGKDLGDMTVDSPKALLKIHNRTILEDTVFKLNRLMVKEISVVRGFKKEMITGANFKTIDNDDYAQTKDLYSLFLARNALEGETIILYGDCIYRSHLMADLLESSAPIRIIVDADMGGGNDKSRDYVTCSQPYTNDFFNRNIFLESVFEDVTGKNAHGEWTGMIAASAAGTAIIRETIEKMSGGKEFNRMSLTDLLKEILKSEKIKVIYTKGGWMDIDTIADFRDAGDF